MATTVTDRPRTAHQLMEEYGLDVEVASLLAAVERGDAMVDDIVFEPPLSDDEKRRMGLGMPIEERIALARRQVQENESNG